MYLDSDYSGVVSENLVHDRTMESAVGVLVEVQLSEGFTIHLLPGDRVHTVLRFKLSKFQGYDPQMS